MNVIIGRSCAVKCWSNKFSLSAVILDDSHGVNRINIFVCRPPPPFPLFSPLANIEPTRVPAVSIILSLDNISSRPFAPHFRRWNCIRWSDSLHERGIEWEFRRVIAYDLWPLSVCLSVCANDGRRDRAGAKPNFPKKHSSKLDPFRPGFLARCNSVCRLILKSITPRRNHQVNVSQRRSKILGRFTLVAHSSIVGSLQISWFD